MDKITATPRLLSYLGFARKAGKLLSGAANCENAIKSNKALLVLISSSASENTVKKFSDMTSFRGILAYQLDSDEIGSAIGKEEHKTVCITDKGFTDAIIKEINLKIGG